MTGRTAPATNSGPRLDTLVREQTEACLDVYRRDAKRVEEDYNLETSAKEGTYSSRQLHELIQNGADALLASSGCIEVVLSEKALYVANEGSGVTPEGVLALLGARQSVKRGEEIGRFGLGFKSVVAISDTPAVFSADVALGFDRTWSAELIRQIVPGRQHYPLLRLAQPLAVADETAEDPELAELLGWATTVVRVPLKDPLRNRPRLATDIKGFPAEFLLFVPHVSCLRLIDKTGADELAREITLERLPEGLLRLNESGNPTEWTVRSTMHTPSRPAAVDAGELAGRQRVEVQWAVPRQNRTSLGEFWAYFPIGERTTLSGIVNAPWKLDDGRSKLIPGDFNHELLTEVLPGLVAAEFRTLVADSDPASALDLLPARGREDRGWADDVINQPVFDAVASQACLPDGAGRYRSPRDIRLHPKGLRMTWLEQWLRSAPDTDQWVHPLVDSTPERRLKADRLKGGAPTADLEQWVEWIARPATPQASADALALVARICQDDSDRDRELRRASILLLEDGTLATPQPGQVFVRSDPEERGFEFIDATLAGIPGALDHLASLGIRVLDRSGELQNALASRRIDWRRIWELTRSVPENQAETLMRGQFGSGLLESVKVFTADRQIVSVRQAFLGGGVVPLDGSRDRAFLINPRFHGPDDNLLRRIGAVEKPSLHRCGADEPWLAAYKDELRGAFSKAAKGAREDKIVLKGEAPPCPLQSLNRLSDPGRLTLTEVALQLDDGRPWTATHETNRAYGKVTAPSPTTWWVKRHGRLQTPFGPWPVDACLSPGLEFAETVPSHVATASREVLPIAEVSDTVASRLGLTPDLSDLTQATWMRMLDAVRDWEDPARRSLLYGWAAAHMKSAPPTIRVGRAPRLFDVPPREAAVIRDKDKYQALLDQGIPTLLVEDPEDLHTLMEQWGLSDGERMLEVELVAEPLGAAEPLVDRFPGLRPYLDQDQYVMELQVCGSISLLTSTPKGQVSKPVAGIRQDNQVLVHDGSDMTVLAQISNALGLDLDRSKIAKLLERQEREHARRLRAEILKAATDAQRLAIAVGAEELRRAIPRTALEAVEGDGPRLTDANLAAMAIAVHGLDVLKVFRGALEDQGLEPPQVWAGRTAARRFVTELGFPVEFAGFPDSRRPATLDVEGPAELAPLHDYQELATAKIKELVRGRGKPRGMLALPTGAGKTRVAVQALVEEIRDGNLGGPLLWIAQSDELCEQAVQTWAYVWRALGPAERLVISRFWAGNDAAEESDAIQLIVATPEKLVNAVDKGSHDWMQGQSLVVIDEAHTAIAPTYTKVLEWLGLGRSRKSQNRLIGLTATPFRSFNDAETKRLIARYDGNRLDHGAFDEEPYAALQNRGVLARVTQEELEGVEVALSRDEQEEISQMRRVPAAVEGRLAANAERNLRIVDSVASLPDDWTALLFATTVENARALAAQLTWAGVPAVAISAQTDMAARRRYVEQFKAGEIRVITNYNVLAQGFDAPAVRAIYVTRPTFSANLYQQMIGRGLRGPKNGGSEEVLIVNVADNLDQFGERLAFTHFEFLWSESADLSPSGGSER